MERTSKPARIRIRGGLRALVMVLCCGGLLMIAVGPAVAAASSTVTAAPEATEQVTGLPTCLLGHWIHSHEEDTAEIQVYRPAGYPFPPSRGRTGFALGAEGDATMYGIAPADGPLVIPGRWLFLPPDTLQIAAMDGSGESHLFTIVSCDSNRLVVTS